MNEASKERLRTRLSTRLKLGAKTVKALPIEFIIGMIFIPLGCTLLAFTLDNNGKDQIMNRQNAEIVDLRTELERTRTEIDRFREVSDRATERERRNTEEGAIRAVVELSLRQEIANLESRLRSALESLDAEYTKHRATVSQLDAASDYVAYKEQQVEDLERAKARLTAILRNRADVEQRITLNCRSGPRSTYRIAGLFVSGATQSLNLSGRPLSDQDLELLGCLRLLQTLRISAVSSSQLDFIPLLSNLSEIILLDSEIESFEFLIGAAKVRSLDVKESTVLSFTGLEALQSLEELSLASIKGQPEMEEISKVRGLKKLDLTGTSPKNFRYISEIRGLMEISLKNSGPIEVGELAGLKSLHRIILPDGEMIGGREDNKDALGEVRGYLAALR